MNPNNPAPGSTGSSSESPPAAGLSDDATKTVISVDQRWLGDSLPSGPGSTLCGRLFPESESGGGVAASGSSVVASPAGVELDHFIIDERIGIGGMGAVFRARDIRLGRSVALKVLSPFQSREPAAVQRFRNEGRAAAQLDHDNIARVFYVGEDRGLHFIAFEFVTGTNVRDLIATGGPLDPADAVNYTLQIASALMHTSSLGVVHRDIKPSNIIITPSGRAKLVDLGLARNADLTGSSGELTSDGTTLGTFDYISPEQARDPRGVDVRSDIYSLGCTLYHMLTGEPPYPEGNAFQKLLDHQGKEPPDAARKNPRVSETLSGIVRRMMASDPDKRFETPEALIRELMFVAGGLGLRGVSSEGMVWMSAGALSGRAWERHLGWIATVAILLVVVVVLRFQPYDRVIEPLSGPSDPVVVVNDAPGVGSESGDPLPAPAVGPVLPTDPRAFQAVVDKKANSESPLRPGTIEPPVAVDPKGPPGSAVTKTAVKPPGDSVTDKGTGKTAKRAGPGPAVKSPDPPLPGPAPAAVNPPPLAAVTVKPVDGGRGKPYANVNAALAEAADGSEIVLSYNGMRVEQPLRVARKNITIRGAEGFEPGIEFRPTDAVGEGVQPRMITVTGGPMQVINTRLRMVVPKTFDEPLALFSLQRPEQVRLSRVVVTIENAASQPVAVFELMPAPGQMRNMKKMMKQEMAAEPLDLSFDRCVFRGHAGLVHVRQADSAEISLNHCVVALGGSLLNVVGAAGTAPKQRGRIDLKLVHVSTLLGDHLVRMDSGDERRNLPVVDLRSRDSIFSHAGNRPLVAMSGKTEIEVYQRLLRWRNDGKNFYDNYSVFWWIGSDQDAITFSGWRQRWELTGSRNESIAWQEPRDSDRKPAFDQLGLDSFRLDGNLPQENRPVATDGSDAGADLALLPAVPLPVTPEQ